jgi:hypothetical protein
MPPAFWYKEDVKNSASKQNTDFKAQHFGVSKSSKSRLSSYLRIVNIINKKVGEEFQEIILNICENPNRKKSKKSDSHCAAGRRQKVWAASFHIAHILKKKRFTSDATEA